MKTKQDKINDGIKRLEKLKQETILRYTADIDYDQELSLYDVMINHFAKGDFDDVFDTDICEEMSGLDRDKLFGLAHEFIGLCFSNGDVDYWLDSLENTPVSDYNLITYSIFNSFEYLLELARDGGRDVLELLVSLRANVDIRDTAIVSYLKNSFIDDKVLSITLLEMAKENSYYDIFTDEQKGILLNYPEGSLYAYGNNEIRITSPLVLGVQIYNSVNSDDPITEVDSNNLEPVILTLKDFFRDENFSFYDEVMSLIGSYRDYVRKNDVRIGTEFSSVILDDASDMIQDAWVLGDSILGSMFDTPYTGGSK